ncbi:hypothetical protein WJX73_008091 [Symbiochloris irregularis]|uniref:Uncharacterized protein n=1 Tax=Symbiochloris irregularis TaxID=706552 RepID=A0AAW1PS54_9CHLO
MGDEDRSSAPSAGSEIEQQPGLGSLPQSKDEIPGLERAKLWASKDMQSEAAAKKAATESLVVGSDLVNMLTSKQSTAQLIRLHRDDGAGGSTGPQSPGFCCLCARQPQSRR